MDTDTQNIQKPSFLRALWQNLLNGWKVVLSECNWLLIKAFRRWEIKQMHKRLNQEYQGLGKLYISFVKKEKILSPQDSEAELLLKQISFLGEEIEHMEQELLNSRSEYVKRRSQS